MHYLKVSSYFPPQKALNRVACPVYVFYFYGSSYRSAPWVVSVSPNRGVRSSPSVPDTFTVCIKPTYIRQSATGFICYSETHYYRITGTIRNLSAITMCFRIVLRLRLHLNQ